MDKKKIIGVSIIIIALLFFIGFDLLDKDKHPLTDKLLYQRLKSENFDNKVIADIKEYENLKTFLALNVDTLISYQELLNKQEIDGVKIQKGDVKIEYQEVTNFILYISGDGIMDTQNIPPHLLDELLVLFNSLTNPLLAVMIDKNKKIVFNINSKFSKVDSSDIVSPDIIISHLLIWNDQNNYENISKDTILNNKTLYRINIEKFTND